jgi:hypothetical protein
MIPDLIGMAVDAMRKHIDRAQREDANAVELAVAYLDAAQGGVEGLGQTAQRLHNAAASFDPASPGAEATAQELLQRVGDYLHTNVLTTELDGVINGLKRDQRTTRSKPRLALAKHKRKST